MDEAIETYDEGCQVLIPNDADAWYNEDQWANPIHKMAYKNR